MNTLSTRQVSDLLERPEVRLIDARPADNYNGWRAQGQAGGGHIRGAKSLPHKWLRYMDWIEIVRNKEILPEHHVVVYGDDAEKTQQAADHFIRAGYARTDVYHNFSDQWVVDETLPMDKLARYRHLVSAQWLQRLIRTGQAPEFDQKRYRVCHAHYQNRGDYNRGHIP